MNYLERTISTELIVKNSRFIAEVFPVTSQTSARDLLREQKKKYADASHVVHAFVIGSKAEILGMSDDGEPSGTAGRPVLDILKSRNCTNIILTITRYFGGTLLGTGGLVKAYGDSAKQVLSLAESSGIIKPLVEKKVFSFKVSYEKHEMVKRYLLTVPVSNVVEKFDTDVLIEGEVELSCAEKFSKDLLNLTGGLASVKLS